MKFSVSMKKNHEFRRLYAKGKSVATPSVVVYCRKIRRRLREIYRLNEERLEKGYDLVVVARVKGRFVSYQTLEKDVLFAMGRLGLISQGTKSGDTK